MVWHRRQLAAWFACARQHSVRGVLGRPAVQLSAHYEPDNEQTKSAQCLLSVTHTHAHTHTHITSSSMDGEKEECCLDECLCMA